MSKELIVSTGRHETRVAILEDDQLVELFHEREKEYSLAGSIHKGRVTRVLPGMQSAFVDIGLERDAFLYVSDFFEDNDEYDAVVSTVEEKVLKMDRGPKLAELEAPASPDEDAVPVREAVIFAPTTPVAERRQESQRGPNREGGDRPPNRDSAPRDGAPRDSAREGTPREGAPRDAASRDAGRDAGRDGGRGRRGRRRRGGRGPGGLPDSKFFTPGSEPAIQAGADEDDEEESTPVTTFVPGPVDDFMVLPGESLAKYSVPVESEPEVEDEVEIVIADDLADDVADDVADDEILVDDIEIVAEIEEPLPTGLTVAELEAEVAALISEAVAEAIAEENAAKFLLPELEPEPEPEPVAAAEEPAVEEAVVAAVPVEDAVAESPEAPAEAEASDETPADESAEPVADDDDTEDSPSDEEAPADSEGDPDDSDVDPEAPVVTEDEGPEPARVPTSLTATLREQGHRYPHRVSRRMRRKGRGGDPKNGEARPEATAEQQPVPEAAEAKPVETREERPAERGNDRPNDRNGDRERGNDRRGGRDRGDRGGDRPERTENREGRSERSERPEREARPDRERPVLPSISDLLKEGQEIIVQIAKEPIGQKGARITSHIALPGRFVVYMPTVDHAGVSRKIPSDDERLRLKKIVQAQRQGLPGGFICRTAAENKTEEELKNDMQFLYNLWLDMRHKAEKKPAPVLLHHDLDLVQRILRDQLTTSFKTIWVDNEDHYESILRFVERFQPALVGRVKLYTRPAPIFDEFGITAEIEKALRPKVWLKSGGYIVINQTEALVAIDINTGKYVGKSNRLEDTIVKVNSDAIKEIVRQIRLRDLGGIIVIDFIDMDDRKNRQKVMLALEDAMRSDRAPYKILQFNDFGLVAITRKRVKQSLERTLCAPCPYCEGAGHVKSVQTVITEVLSEAVRMKKALAEEKQGTIMLRVNPEVAKVLKSNHNQFLQEIEEILGKSVLVKSDPLLHQTKFDLA